MSERLLTAKAVMARFGGITTMTLWRWLKDENLTFPRPIYIGRRRYFQEADVEGFMKRMALENLCHQVTPTTKR